MPAWNPRSLPYPLLASWTEDYERQHTFRLNVPTAVIRDGDDINLTLQHHLTSDTLRNLIDDRKAKYVTIASCPQTGRRDVVKTTHEEDLATLEAGNYKESLHLLSYITATTRLMGWTSEEHSAEFTEFRPDGFDIASGSILAAADEVRIDIEEGASPFSIIDIVQDDRVAEGRFSLDLDDVRIKVHLAPKDKARVEALRKRGPMDARARTLVPALYMHAITEALRNIGSGDRWNESLRRALEKNDIQTDDQNLADEAVRYAQEVLDGPMGHMLAGFDSSDED